jgi:hypothetical protein
MIFNLIISPALNSNEISEDSVIPFWIPNPRFNVKLPKMNKI